MSINLGDYLDPNADQLSADHLLAGPRVVTITSVKVYRDGKGKSRVELGLEEFDVPYRPCLTMGRVLDKVWGGKDASTRYIGRKMLLFNDTSVMFGPQKTGGVRIKGLSHIDKPTTADGLTIKKGIKSSYTVEPLKDEPAPAPVKQPTPAGIIKAFTDLGVTVTQLEARVGAPAADWSAAEVATLAALGRSITSGETTAAAEFQAADDSQMAMNTTEPEAS